MKLLYFVAALQLIAMSMLPLARSEIRINCMPEAAVEQCTRAQCDHRKSVGCVWHDTAAAGAPRCVFDASDTQTMAAYDANSFTWTPSQGRISSTLTRRSTQSLYGGDYATVHFEATQIDRAALKLTFSWNGDGHNGNEDRAEDTVDYDMQMQRLLTVTAGDMNVQLQSSPFGFKIQRASSDPVGFGSTSPVLFDTIDLPAMIFSKHFVQINAKVTQGANVYGLGQQFHLTLARNFNYSRHSMLNLDQMPVRNMNLYGAQPFYVGSEANSTALHGVFLQTDYPMDVFLQPDPQLLSYRVAGESGSVSLYFFGGPTYDQVIQQYVSVIGKPYFPPFWALGFHLSRYGYNNTAELKKVWDRNRAARIPQDVQVVDIDYMDHQREFTVGQSFHDLPHFVTNTIHASGRKLVPITEPAIASDPKLLTTYKPLKVGLEMDLFVKDAKTGKPIQTKVWPGDSYMPDFTHPNATPYWLAMMSEFHNVLSFDGAWLDMNEPATFVDGSSGGCASNQLNNPPFSPVTYSPIYKKTLCMDAVHYGNKTHMQVHNHFGHYVVKTTHLVFSKMDPDKRPFIYTRANAPGTGVFAGNWMGDTLSNWESLAQSIIGLIEMNMFGIPMTGTDICGFNGDTTEELCMRWHQLGAFYPFCRNHNGMREIDQDPAAWGNQTVLAIRRSLRLRYSLLPYLYTLLSGAHVKGTPVVRPIFALRTAAAAGDSDTRAQLNIADQFMWGKALMVTPIVKKGTVKRSVYFPPGVWYPLMKNALIDGEPDVHWIVANASTGGVTKEVQTQWEDVSLFLQGGHSIFRQGHGETTAESMRTPFKVEVGLDAMGNSHGQLYWDDGVDPRAPYNGKYCLVDAKAWSQGDMGGTVQIVVLHNGCASLPAVREIRLHGLDASLQLHNVVVTGGDSDAPVAFGYDSARMLHYVVLPHVQVHNGFAITWQQRDHNERT